MAIAFVRTNNSTGSGLTPFVVNVPASTAGNLLVATFMQCQVNTFISITGGGTWVEAFNRTNGAQVRMFYAKNIAGGSFTLQVDCSADFFADMSLSCTEFSGVSTTSPLTGTPSTNASTSTTGSTGSTTPADNDCLVVAAFAGDFPTTITQNAGGQGFTLIDEMEGDFGTLTCSSVYKILSGAPAAQNESWGLGNLMDWAAGIAAFTPGGTPPPPVDTALEAGFLIS